MYFVKGDISINLSQQAQEKCKKNIINMKKNINEHKKEKTTKRKRKADGNYLKIFHTIFQQNNSIFNFLTQFFLYLCILLLLFFKR